MDTPRGRKFKVVRVVRESGLCLGRIGSGETVCLKEDAKCTTKHEGGDSLDVSTTGFIIVVKKLGIGFLRPMIQATAISDEVWMTWKDTEKSIDDWEEKFVVDGTESPTKEARQGKAHSRDFDDPETPKKRAKTMGQDLEDFQPYLTQFETGEAREFIEDSSDGTMASYVAGLDYGLSDVAFQFQTFGNEAKNQVLALEESVDKNLEKALYLTDLIGDGSGSIPTELLAPTVFGTLRLLTDYVQLENTKLNSSISEMKREVQAVKVQAYALMSSLMDRTDKVESKVVELRDMGSTGGEVTDNQKVEEIAELVEHLERQVNQIKADGENSAIKFAGLGLQSADETAAWIEMHFPSRSYGLIVDVYLLCDMIAQESSVSQTEMLNIMHKRKSLQINTAADAQAIGAFLLEIPKIFHVPKSETTAGSDTASQFSKLPTWEHWGKHPHGLKFEMGRRLIQSKSAIEKDIRRKLTGPVYIVAIEALEKGSSWLLKYMGWIDTTYDHLLGASKFTKKQAWTLTTQLAKRVFTDISGMRRGLIETSSTDVNSMCTSILWGVFQTHDKMEEFNKLNFADHPSIASEYTKFLATNAGHDSVEALAASVTSLTSDVSTLKTQLAEARRRADTASTKADAVDRLINPLTQRLKKLEVK